MSGYEDRTSVTFAGMAQTIERHEACIRQLTTDLAAQTAALASANRTIALLAEVIEIALVEPVVPAPAPEGVAGVGEGDAPAPAPTEFVAAPI